jgi:hypothetical protein
MNDVGGLAITLSGLTRDFMRNPVLNDALGEAP